MPHRSSLPALARRSPSCASRASTAMSKWPPRSTAPASPPFDVHMSDILAGRASLGRFQGAGRLRRLLLRRRARRRPGLGQVHPLQRRARDEFAAFFGAQRYLRAGRLQRLPDDGAARADHPRRRALADLRAQRSEQFEARFVDGRSARISRRSSSPAWPAVACRSSCRTARAGRCSRDEAIDAGARLALRYVDNHGEADRSLSVQPERFAGRHHRRHHRRRPLHDHDAAPGTHLPHACRCRGTRRTRARIRRGCACSAMRGGRLGK